MKIINQVVWKWHTKLVLVIESLLRNLESIVKALFMADPAVLRVTIIDTDGMELVSLSKNHYTKKDALPPMINQMHKFFEQFLPFMKKNTQDQFIFSWYFNGMVLFCAGSPYGSIILYCDNDVNPGLVKKILKNAIGNFRLVMGPVFQ